MITTVIRFINIMLAALVAGVSFGTWLGFEPARLSTLTFIEQQQYMLVSLKPVMLSLLITATVITFFSAYLQKSNKRVMVMLQVAAFFFLLSIGIVFFGSKPIENNMMTWGVANLPANWMELRDKWWELHIMQTLTEITALILVTWTSIRKDNIAKVTV
jgi:hypothetical protein